MGNFQQITGNYSVSASSSARWGGLINKIKYQLIKGTQEIELFFFNLLMLEFYLFSIAKIYLHYLYMHFKGILFVAQKIYKAIIFQI